MPPHPFHLPELRVHISRFLDLTDLKTCMLVCKAWHTDFQPSVWEFAVLNFLRQRLLTDELLDIREKSIKKNARWIRHLTLPHVRHMNSVRKILDLLKAHCTALLALDLSVQQHQQHLQQRQSSFAWDTWDTYYLGLLANNPKLQRVRLRFVPATTVANAEVPVMQHNMHLVLATLQHLHTLELDGVMPLQSILVILQSCPSVTHLVIHAPRRGLYYGDEDPGPHHNQPPALHTLHTLLYPPPSSSSSGPLLQPPSTTLPPLKDLPTTLPLRQLEISGPCNDHALGLLLDRCPSLHSLRLGLVHPQASLGLCAGLAEGLIRLTSLRLGSHRMDTSAFLKILGCLPEHRLREVNLMWAGEEALRELVDRQARSLEVLQATASRNPTGALTGVGTGGAEGGAGSSAVVGASSSVAATQTVVGAIEDEGWALAYILARCHRLRRLTFVTERAVEGRLLLGRPWTCRELEYLDVSLTLDRHCKNGRWMHVGSWEKQKVAPGKTELEQAEALLMQRLGQLTQLRQLILPGKTTMGWQQRQDDLYRGRRRQLKQFLLDKEGLTWSLANGLKYLAGLVRLEILRFGSQPLPLGIQELEFLKQAWRNLRLLRCYSIESQEISQWMKEEWPALHVGLEIYGEYWY
ncbi:hypothetical protein DFQ26_003507 [Actinomortierella ambigua]|nr:hypothetical protein DFQ26_003507 [Actinomortierella ambigua]